MVITPAEAVRVDALMIEVLVATPLMVEVRILAADTKSLLFIKRAVVVAGNPLMMEVRTKELVDVAMVSVFEVEDAIRLARLVDVATPLMIVVRSVPDVEIALLVMSDVVAVSPLIVVERTLPADD